MMNDNGKHPATSAEGEMTPPMQIAPALTAEEALQFQRLSQVQSALTATIADTAVKIAVGEEAKSKHAEAVKALRDSRDEVDRFLSLVSARTGVKQPFVFGPGGTVISKG
jgi:thymidine phosphorylase